MKRCLSVIIFSMLFSALALAQETPIKTGKLYAVIEYRHSSEMSATPDVKTSEINGIVRYMTSCSFGFTAVGRMNDTSSNFMAGVTFMPTDWVRFDFLGGSRAEYREQKSIVGFRFWAGNSWQNFWFNIDGGSAPVWLEGIYLLKATPWLDFGAMAQTVGVGPRIDLNLPVFANGEFRIWGAVLGNWHNTNAGQPGGGYNPKALYAMIGVKTIF